MHFGGEMMTPETRPTEVYKAAPTPLSMLAAALIQLMLPASIRWGSHESPPTHRRRHV